MIKEELLNPLEGVIEEGEIEIAAESSKKKRPINGRYQGEDREKCYKTKRRRVNRQVEEVYLQRLVASSDQKNRNLRSRNLDF